MSDTKHPFKVKTCSAWDFTGYSEEALKDAIRLLNNAKGTNEYLPGPLNNILKAFHKALELKNPDKASDYNPVYAETRRPQNLGDFRSLVKRAPKQGSKK